MSKAFVNDDAVAPEVTRPLPVGRRPITERGARQMQHALRALVDEEIPRLKAQAATAEPDAVRLLATALRRAAELQRIIALSDVVTAPGTDPKRVALGCEVSVRDEETDEVRVYAVVGPDEVDVEKRHVSHISPIGRALLNRSVGERVFIKRPIGTLEVVVERIAPLRNDA